jgi:hypothetical protein
MKGGFMQLPESETTEFGKQSLDTGKSALKTSFFRNSGTMKILAFLIFIAFIIAVAGCGGGKYFKITQTETGKTYYSKEVKMKKDGIVIFNVAGTGEQMKLEKANVETITKKQFDNALSLGVPAAAAVSDICSSTAGVNFVVTNNCSVAQTVLMNSDNQQYSPGCLNKIAPKETTKTFLLPENHNYAFWVGNYGSATLCELTLQSNWQSYNISFNQGFNIGMTLVAPVGMVVPRIVAKTSKAYGAYPLKSELPECYTAPCYQPNYGAVPIGGTYHLYLCNRPEDTASTPGPYGCKLNECPPHGKMENCPDWRTLPCQGTPKLTGGDCAESCPGT